MAFLVYFFVLLAMAGSILFGLDWVNAPLHSPNPHERAQAATSGIRAKAERGAQHRAPVANSSASAQRAQIAASVGRRGPAAVPQQQSAAATSTAPTPPEQTKTAASAAQAPQAEQASSAQHPPMVTRPASSAPTQAVASAPQASPEPVTEQQRPAANPGRDKVDVANTKASAAASAAVIPKPRPKPDLPHRASSQTAAHTAASARTPRTAHRQTDDAAQARAPAWAIRGAEAARREAEQGRKAGVPAWALRGAEAATREAEDDAEPREVFRPFWASEQR